MVKKIEMGSIMNAKECWICNAGKEWVEKVFI